MTAIDTVGIDRPVRLVFPVKVTFAGDSFEIHEVTANLSVGGIFLPTDRIVPARTLGSLTFRVSRWEEPFTVQAEVVRVAPPTGAPEGHDQGLGIMFVGLRPEDKQRLQRLVDGIRDGSIAESIRRTIKQERRQLLQELRSRPADQKIVFAGAARAEEINALIRDGNPAVLLRLLENPRLSQAHVRLIVRDPRTPDRILAAIHGNRRWMGDEEIRAAYCVHPNARVPDVQRSLPQLSTARLTAISRNAAVREQVRTAARTLVDRSTAGR